MNKKSIVVEASKGASKSIRLLLTERLLANTAEIPIIRRIFAIFEPTAFAETISVLSFKTAATEEASSGKEVPIATIVTPIMKGEILKARPIFSALSTNQSADLISKVKEKRKISIQKNSITRNN